MKAWIARHAVASYYFMAYACTWSIAIPLALQAQGVTKTQLPLSLHYLSSYGPAIGAMLLSWLLRERLGGGDETHAAAGQSHRAKWVWRLVGVASPLLLFASAKLVGVVAHQPTPGWLALGRVNFLPDLALAAWPLWFLTSGVGEELGWRGFALPRLQRTHSALASSVLLSVGWAGWHIPAFFYVPSYLAMGLGILPGFFLGVLSGAIVLTWLFNRSGGSLLAVMLWHASFNFVTASPNAGGLAAAVTSTLVMVWAVIVVWRYDAATLTHWRTRSVRADRRERMCTLSGDELIPAPIASITHAISIARAPHDVWPWLAQMGAGSRAGWYSYDFIDNGGHSSATCIVSELQHIDVGTVFPALPGVTDGFTVAKYEPDHFLVIGWPSRPATWLMTWAFVLERVDDGSTRLIVRARGGPGYQFHRLPWGLAKLIVPVVHFIMQRRQLLGIAARAEHDAARHASPRGSDDVAAA